MNQILFNAEMAKAILNGRKNQTRRVVPDKVIDKYYEYDDWASSVGKPGGVDCVITPEKQFYLERSKYQIGDILWVREPVKVTRYDDILKQYDYRYLADGKMVYQAVA